MDKKEELENQETALERIEPELEETETYKKASFGEKISLKLRKRLIASRFKTFILILIIVIAIWGINIWAESKKLAQIDAIKIPEGFDPSAVRGLLFESSQKLREVKPQTLGQASRIPGVTPADIQLLAVHIERFRRLKNAK